MVAKRPAATRAARRRPAAPGRGAAPPAELARELGQQVTEQRKFVENGFVPGFAQALIWRGSVVHTSCYGLADPEAGTPFTEDTVVRLYSMTKPLTAVGLMILVEQGRVGLDKPVSAYLPCFRRVRSVRHANQIQAAEGAPAHAGPTVRQLLMHTSGLSYGAFFGTAARYACEKEYAELVRGVDEGSVCSLESFVEELAKLPLRFRPGERWEYSHGPDVIGRVIEVVSGLPLSEFLERRLFRPLRMMDTAFEVRPRSVGRLAALYRQGPDGREQDLQRLDGGQRSAWTGERRCPIDSGGGFMGCSFPASDAATSVGGAVSTLRDYARFVGALENLGRCPETGVRILRAESVQSMLSNWLELKSVAGGRRRIPGWHDAGRGSIGWCPLGQVSRGESLPKVWMGGIAGTFWAIDRELGVSLVHVQQAAPERSTAPRWGVGAMSALVRITTGIMPQHSRVGVSRAMAQFGEVIHCHKPPYGGGPAASGIPGEDFVNVRFATQTGADAAYEALKNGSVFIDGFPVGVGAAPKPLGSDAQFAIANGQRAPPRERRARSPSPPRPYSRGVGRDPGDDDDRRGGRDDRRGG
ncbi:unnamed protein product, partial [Prorocentrum cordatum]